MPPLKPTREMFATAKLVKKTHNSAVFACLLGPSLYIAKNLFDTGIPRRAIITVAWDEKECDPLEDQPQVPVPTANTPVSDLVKAVQPLKENNKDGKTK